MPKYRILCSTTTSYWLDVEAPSWEAARQFYGRCDGGEFHKGQEDDWSLDDLVETDDCLADVTVDAEGKVVDA